MHSSGNRIVAAALAWLAVAAFAITPQPGSAPASAAPDYRIEAIRFGTLQGVRLGALLEGESEEQKVAIAAVVWLIRGGGRTILFDTGYYKDKVLMERSVDYVSPDVALREAGVEASAVTDVIISHAHNDHMDGINLFPNAMIWIQKGEYEYYSKDAWQPGGTTRGMNPDNVIDLVRKNIQGHVRLIDGDNVEILPGITVYTGARHTFASQYIRVAGNPPYVLASDNCFLYENLKSRRASGSHFAPEDGPAQVAAIDRMITLAGSPDRVVPGHDALQFQRFPSKGRIARIR